MVCLACYEQQAECGTKKKSSSPGIVQGYLRPDCANFVVLYLMYIVYMYLYTGEWSQLCSLDLICDSPKAFEKWTSAVSGYRCDKDVM